MVTSILTSAPPPQDITKNNEPLEIEVNALSIREKISYFSSLYEISDEIPLAISKAESHYRNVCNEKYGCKAGIGPMQIVQSTFDEQCYSTSTPIMTDVFNETDNIQCGVKMIKNEDYWRWNPSMDRWLPTLATTTREKIEALCSCVKGLRSFGVNFPAIRYANELPANSSPHVGVVALFNYSNEQGHVALIIQMTSEYMIVKDTNYKRCAYTERKVYYDDPAIKGFYDPHKN